MSTKSNAGSLKVILAVVLCLLIVGLGAGAYIVFNGGFFGDKTVNTQGTQAQSSPSATIKPDDKIKEGVVVAGINVGGMDKTEVESAIKAKEDQLLKDVKISFKAADKQYDYAAKDIGVTLDMDTAITEAFKGSAASIDIKFKLDAEFAKNKLTLDSAAMSVAPVDAKVEFTPNEKERFKYTDEINGSAVKVDDLVTLIDGEVKSGKFSVIDAPVETTLAAVKVADLKLITAPIVYTYNSVTKKRQVGFTSYYRKASESSKNRMFNINKLAGILNGSIIQPGDTFSVNKKAGNRTLKGGWKPAHGIVDGRYEDQPGGGVCQVSGTLYNTVLRAELEIVYRQHHSWPSTYLPKGLDATISSGSPDFKFKNPFDTPVYLVLHADTKDKSLTIEIYGKVPDTLANGVWIDFTNKQIKTIPQPTLKTVEATETPEGTPIAPGKQVEYKEGHTGSVWVVYKQYKDKGGKVLSTKEHHRDTYKAFGKVIYKHTADPTPSPSTPAPTPSPSPSSSAT